MKNWGNTVGQIIEAAFYAPEGKWARFKNIDESNLQVPHSPNYNVVIRLKMLECRLAVLSGFIEDIEKSTTTIIDESGVVPNTNANEARDRAYTAQDYQGTQGQNNKPGHNNTPVAEAANGLINAINQEGSLKDDTRDALNYLVKIIAVQSTRSADMVDKRLVDNSLKLMADC